jgi:hypothetical protein
VRNRRGIVAIAIGALLAAVAVGAVAHDTATSSRISSRALEGTPTVSEHHTLDAVAPALTKVGTEVVRRVIGARGDFGAATLVAIVIAIGVAMRLRRDRRPLHSRHVLQSIVRGRSPPPLLVVH